MIAELRAKVGADAIPVAQGDMATTRVDGEFSLAYLVFNTISNLQTQDEQVECFRNAARHLSPRGRFVVESGVPDLRTLPVGADGDGVRDRTRLPGRGRGGVPQGLSRSPAHPVRFWATMDGCRAVY